MVKKDRKRNLRDNTLLVLASILALLMIIIYYLVNYVFTNSVNNLGYQLDISMLRDLNNIFSNSLLYMAYALIAAWVIFTIVVFIFMEKRVLSRIQYLTKFANKVGLSCTLTERLEKDNYNDDLTDVAVEINSMLDRLSEAERAIRESEQKFRTFVEKSNGIVYTLDLQGQFTYISPNCNNILNCTAEEILGKTILDIVHPDDTDRWMLLLSTERTYNETQQNHMECRVKNNGDWNWYSSSVSLVRDNHDNHMFLGILHDINEKVIAENMLKEAHAELEEKVLARTSELATANEILKLEMDTRIKTEERIRFLAYHDHLTELPNRLLFSDRLEQAVLQAQRTENTLAVMYLDLDDFKRVNDTMGHAQGDNLLIQTADRLSSFLRKSDTVARVGGDEFILLFQNIKDFETIEKIAEKILKSFIKPFPLNDQLFHVTASMGIAVYPNDGKDVETLIKNADISMYKAKEKRRNSYVLCTPLLKNKVKRTLALTNGLYRALERKELLLYYQPQISYNSQKIVGLEALLRWQHPKLGMVSPSEFIPIAEYTGLIINIGEWVLNTASKQNKAWQNAGLPAVRVSVNVSTVQFHNPNFVNQIQTALQKSKLDSTWLELEITENTVIREPAHVIEMLHAIKDLGVTISIDDFGTEYSSMSYLKQMPVDRIKIAMPFVQGIDINEKDEAITKGILVLARSLGLNIIAEGVETERQLSFLTKRMCDEIQGFYYYKPMPVNEIEVLLRNQLENDTIPIPIALSGKS